MNGLSVGHGDFRCSKCLRGSANSGLVVKKVFLYIIATPMPVYFEISKRILLVKNRLIVCIRLNTISVYFSIIMLHGSLSGFKFIHHFIFMYKRLINGYLSHFKKIFYGSLYFLFTLR